MITGEPVGHALAFRRGAGFFLSGAARQSAIINVLLDCSRVINIFEFQPRTAHGNVNRPVIKDVADKSEPLRLGRENIFNRRGLALLCSERLLLDINDLIISYLINVVAPINILINHPI